MSDVPVPVRPASPPCSHALSAALATALARECGERFGDVLLERLADTGLAHEHIRLVGTGVLARIPKQSQMGLTAQANLDHQAACFGRASVGRHAPRLVGRLSPSSELPRGALLVDEIAGRPAHLPGDLVALAQALAALHGLPLPVPAQRPPLADAVDPLAALVVEIETQAAFADRASLPDAVAHGLRVEQQTLRAAVARAGRPPRRLIAFDAHPGNFIVRDDGVAILVDLEKCRYSYPGLDLAHATLYTSTTWDAASHAVLDPSQVASAYAAWSDAVGAQLAAASRPWHLTLRRAMWLWSMSWCAKWRVLAGTTAAASADGEDWSAERSDPALVDHVRGRVDHYLSAAVVEAQRDEFDALEAAWS